MKQTISIIIIYFFLVIQSCNNNIEGELWRDGDFFILRGNTPELCYNFNNNDWITIINNVSKIGSNEKFIIIESLLFPKSKNKMYWIIDKNNINLKTIDEKRIIPLDSVQFNTILLQKNILGISFSEEYKF